MSNKQTAIVHIDKDQASIVLELPDLKRLNGLAPRVRVLLDVAIAARAAPRKKRLLPSQVIGVFPELGVEGVKEVAIAALEYLSSQQGGRERDEDGERAIRFIRAQLGLEKISGCDLAILAASLKADGQNLQKLLNQENAKNGNLKH